MRDSQACRIIIFMAQPFLDQLEQLARRHLPDDPELICKHFFGGAALYSCGVICVSLSPVGLAFKLPNERCAELIESDAACPLRYFPKAPIKKGYVLFAVVEEIGESDLGSYFRQAVAYASGNSTPPE